MAQEFQLDDLSPGPPIVIEPPRAPRGRQRSHDRSGTDLWRSVAAWDQVRLALAAFVALELVALVVLFIRLSDSQWFRLAADDTDFLITRRLTVEDLFLPHFGHWVTLPVMAYKALFALFGFDYRAYLFTLLVLHLGVVALLRVIMRRVGVGPWIATAVAAALLVYGSGRDDIVYAFQITFTGAVLFGLIQLVLADHDGRIDRRDWLGLLAGAAALLCSGVGPVMVAIVGIATLLRRSWRAALFHTVPLGVMYAAWYLVHRDDIERQTAVFTGGAYGPGQAISFVWNGLSGSFRTLGGSPVAGILLAVGMVAGLALAWAPMPWAEFRRRAAMPVALLMGEVAFLAVAGHERTYFGTAHAVESRYLYILVAFTLPAMGVAVDALTRAWRFAAIPADRAAPHRPAVQRAAVRSGARRPVGDPRARGARSHVRRPPIDAGRCGAGLGEPRVRRPVLDHHRVAARAAARREPSRAGG